MLDDLDKNDEKIEETLKSSKKKEVKAKVKETKVSSDENVENKSEESEEKVTATKSSKKKEVKAKVKEAKVSSDEKVKNKSEESKEKVTSTKESEKKVVKAKVKETKGSSDNKVEKKSEEAEEKVISTKSKKTTKTEKSEKEVIEEIDEKVAEKSEKEEHTESIEKVDYSSMSLEDITKELSKLVKERPIHLIKSHVNTIKSAFNKQFGAELGKAKQEFLDAGGNSIDFYFSDPIKKEYNSLLFEYKTKLDSYYKEIDERLHQNLNLRISTIDKLKHLIEDHDSETMYKEFKEIQSKWNNIGPVPRTKYNDTWRTYHHHVERFYDLLHLNNDLRDLDFKHNLEEKLKLTERANELVELDDINFAFKELQGLHKKWKEEIGPVSREIREEVWEKFSEATKKIHDRRHDHLRDLRSKFEDNIDLKLAVIEEINNFDTSNFSNHSHWQNGIKKIEELREKFFNIGRVPKERSDEIWQKFKDATRLFNKNKNDFYKNIKKDQINNLNLKYKLIEKAEALKDSEDWDHTLNEMKKIQVDWKKIGHVPRKYSDKIWKQFKSACNHYFNRYHAIQDKDNSDQLEVFNKKKVLLEEFKNSKISTLDEIKEYIVKWRALGRVPFEMKHIEIKFNKTLDSLIKELDIDKSELEMIKFKNIVDGYNEQKDYRKIENEQSFIRKKIDETVREIQQLENNIGFVSNISGNNTLLDNVKKNIEQYKLDLVIWKSKLNYLRKVIE